MDDTPRPPRHFWPVAVLGLPWNAFGAWDWLMTNMRDAAYVAQLPSETMQYVDAMPYWALGTWTLGVWAAVLGSVLLLRRSRFAVHAFAASLIGLALGTVYQASIDLPAPMATGPMIAMTLVVWIGAIALLWYAVRMRKAGVLR